MTPQVTGLSETFLALRTLVGLLSRVLSDVLFQCAGRCERSLAQFALVGPFSGVNSLVLFQIVGAGEDFLARWALVSLQRHAVVRSHFGLLDESLSALPTLVELRSDVFALMGSQIRSNGESSSARRALERLFSAMATIVVFQFSPGHKGFRAKITRKRLYSVMPLQMGAQTGFRAQNFITIRSWARKLRSVRIHPQRFCTRRPNGSPIRLSEGLFRLLR